jgi:hypothetical protein
MDQEIVTPKHWLDPGGLRESPTIQNNRDTRLIRPSPVCWPAVDYRKIHTNATPARNLDLRDDCSFRITVGNIEPAHTVERLSHFAGVQNIAKAPGSDLPDSRNRRSANHSQSYASLLSRG